MTQKKELQLFAGEEKQELIRFLDEHKKTAKRGRSYECAEPFKCRGEL